MLHELTRLGYNAAVARASAALPPGRGPLARVVERHRGHCVVCTGERQLEARSLPALERATDLAVGDWVRLVGEPGGCWIADCLGRYGVLQRLDPAGHPQLLVANVDVAFLVIGLDADFNPRRLERYLAFVRAAGVRPVVVVTKADLCGTADAGRSLEASMATLAERLPAGVDRYAIVATDPSSVGVLMPYLQPGTTVVLLGSSGAGKSTLTNSLAGAALLATGAVRASDARGRHTTTSRHLVQLPGGACVIDTPGLRGLRLDIDPAEVEALFEDIAVLAAGCRFRDCTHRAEPGCAVRDAVTADRLANFQKLQQEALRDRADPGVQRARKARGKVLSRAQRAFGKLRGR